MPTEKGQILIPIARATISQALGKPMQAREDAAWLKELGACFITLTQQGELRGCIGSLEAHRPLLQDVKANTYAAAFRDPRFSPLTLGELDYTEVEVSLLSPMQPISFCDEREALAQLRPGIDGVVFEFGAYRSTFLPQVWEQLPECGIFMAHLKRKAGLPPDFWAEEVKLSCYTVSKWKESELI
ncbi:MAG: AmmeMemoRadiSam system protein A [Sulfuricella sp.]|nr:AmmeMemoRadiSam system protein A [Sulfuricella sp.]